jgi:hypothetical protein
MPPTTHCACGVELPTHIAKHVPTRVRYEHTCSCRRRWKYVDAVWVQKIGEGGLFHGNRA